jgi:hypothetical protein
VKDLPREGSIGVSVDGYVPPLSLCIAWDNSTTGGGMWYWLTLRHGSPRRPRIRVLGSDQSHMCWRMAMYFPIPLFLAPISGYSHGPQVASREHISPISYHKNLDPSENETIFPFQQTRRTGKPIEEIVLTSGIARAHPLSGVLLAVFERHIP